MALHLTLVFGQYDKDKYDKKDGILSRKEAGKMLDKFMLGNFLKTFINDLPLIPADKVSALLPVRSACIELLLHRKNCSSPNHPSRPKRSWSLYSYLRWMQTRCAQPLCCSADCEAQDGVVEEHEFMEGIDCALKAVLLHTSFF